MPARTINLNIKLDSEWRFEGDAASELAIDYHDLPREALHHPGKAAWWGVFASKIERKVEALEASLKRAEYSAYLHQRSLGVGTEKMADAQARLDPDRLLLERELQEWSEHLRSARAIVFGLADRRHSIESLLRVSLATDPPLRFPRSASPDALPPLSERRKELSGGAPHQARRARPNVAKG